MLKFFIVFLFINVTGLNYHAGQHGKSSLAYHENSPDYYEMGKQILDKGRWETALKVWLQGINEGTKTGNIDPRLGFIFIETVTAYEAKKYYRNAQRAYFWALKPFNYSKFSNTYQEEFQRLNPLLSNEISKKIQNKIKANDSTFINDLRNFWEHEDPVLTTSLNERLLEHWERISIARNKYQKTITTIYNTDDRGEIFIKYGAPERIHAGTLTFDQALFRSKASELIDLLNPSSALPADSSSSVLATSSSSVYSKDAQLYNLMNKAREYFRNAEYEIWIYSPVADEIENSLFIFGQNGNSGRWELLDSIEEMIPNGAFGIRGDQARTMGTPISPGLMMQVMAYHQLSHLDEFFLNASIDLESEIFSSLTNNSLYLDVAARNRNEFNLSNIQTQMPPEYSGTKKNIPGIDLTFSTYRLIDEMNEPQLLIAMKSKPQKALVSEWLNQLSDDQKLNYNLVHSSKLISVTNGETLVQSDTANILYSESIDEQNRIESTSTLFAIPNIRNSKSVISAELLHGSKDLKQDSDKLFGLGLATIEHGEPLSTGLKGLEMSDLILGYSKSTDSPVYLPFIISFDNSIPEGENLVVHFEVYQLRMQNGNRNFSLTYQIEPKERGLKKLFGSKDDKSVSLTLQLNALENSFKEDLEIKTSDLPSGTYELFLTASQPGSRESKRRTVTFTIKEP